MGFHLHRAERADRLADALGDLLGEPLDDPFTTEVVSVATHGIERWLAQRLSHRLGTSPGGRDGVCTQVAFPSLGRMLGELDQPVGGPDDAGWRDPWDPRRAVWPLLDVLDRSRGEEWADLIWAHLTDSRRRFGFVQHLATLFHAYSRNRPEMMAAWLAGADVDPAGRPLTQDRVWQAAMWRRLHAEIGQPSPTERLAELTCALSRPERELTLPPRISVFGVTRLDNEQIQMLDALASIRDVHLWLPHPSPALWDAVAARLAERPSQSLRRVDDPTVRAAEHRLLDYLGRDCRELQARLFGVTASVVTRHYPAKDHLPLTLLHRLQGAIATNTSLPPPSARPFLDSGDASLAVHAAHGPDRQVEVLREVLVGLLADDETLEPRDIVVMCPDIETYAPLISAGFGLDTDESETGQVSDGVGKHPGHRLRVRLADRSLRSLNPLLASLSRLLDLADSRVEASALLDLCLSAPVARKFGFGEDDAERIPELVARSGVRWGLDASHRAAFGLSGFGQNTWAAGLDRMLLGIAMDEDGQHYIGTALPMDDIDAGDVDLVGRLTECVDRVRAALDALSLRQTVESWMTACGAALASLCAAAPGESWQTSHASAQLYALAETAAGSRAELSLSEVRALMADAFRGRASRANFRTGTLTMCTMLPMRSVPHRVVCLLGLDDGVFPRRTSVDGDDIAALEPYVGDRDPRSEDRQLFLDAIMAAEERLVIVYAGADPRTGADKPPAVPLGELLDVVDASVQGHGARLARELITVRHPLQPFSPRNFAPDAIVPSFDPGSLRGARASVRPRQPAPAVFDAQPLPPAPLPDVVNLAELLRFYNHPIKALLRVRGGLTAFDADETADDELPVDLSGLDTWSIGDRLLRLHLRGADLEQLASAEWRRGSLPPRAFGAQRLRPVLDHVRTLVAVAAPHLVGTPASRDVAVELNQQALAGTVSGLYEDRLVRVTYSRLAAKHRLQAWIELLAISAAHPGTRWRAITVGRGGTSSVGPVDVVAARSQLGHLVDTYRAGLREPLPFSPKASAEYARIRFEGRSVQALAEAIERKWAEDRDPAYERFFGVRAPLSSLTAAPSRPDETTATLPAPTRFGTLALRVFEPLLTAEVRS